MCLVVAEIIYIVKFLIMVVIKLKVIAKFYDTQANNVLRNKDEIFEVNSQERANELVGKKFVEILEITGMQEPVETLPSEGHSHPLPEEGDRVHTRKALKPKKVRKNAKKKSKKKLKLSDIA